jgi:frataxin-like iron-binding protein CyaY
MDEKEFQKRYDTACEGLRRRLAEPGDVHGFEVEGGSGKLEVLFEEPQETKFIISPNAPVRQAWISALSTSFKLSWSDAPRAFVFEKTGETPMQLMGRILTGQLGSPASRLAGMAPLSQHVAQSSGLPANAAVSVRSIRGPRRRAFFTLLVFVAMTATAPAQDKAFARAASVLQPQAYVSLQPVPRGRSFEVAVVAKITPGFHVNAHEPSEEYLIPTKITADLPPGIVLLETTYPRGVMRGFRFAKTELRVYDGSFTVRMKLRAEAGAPLGPQKIGLTVAYQACNQDACLPPTRIPVTAELEIAAMGAPAHPANAEIFKRNE